MIDLDKQYPSPSTPKNRHGANRYAYVTFVMRNDSFIPGALLFAFALRRQKAQGDLVCMVTKDVSPASRLALEVLFDHVPEVDEVYLHHKRRQERQDRPYLFTRFQALRTGEDGGLGFRYEKIVLSDADILPLRNFDHLFTLETPAGIINESKNNCVEYDSRGRYIVPQDVDISGKWKWHDIYDRICPHGTKIPCYITDRVISDPKNLGVNSSLWVLQPSMKEYDNILNDISKSDVSELVGNTFNWPEMQYATMHWSGLWTSIDLRFSSFNGYPKLSVLCGTHFAGYKPWNFKKAGTLARFSRFPDYKLWHTMFLEMMKENDRLSSNKKLLQIELKIQQLTALQ